MRNKKKLIIVLILFVNTLSFSQNSNPIKVACIGNSITYGAGINNRINDAYPAQLNNLLGENYEIKNYGFSGRTLLSKGDYPYMMENMFFNAIKWNPDIVIIKLGTNDSKPQNWKYKKDFEVDYNKMITAFDTLSSKPQIYIATIAPVFKTYKGITDSIVKNEINPLIKKIANTKKLNIIDFYTPLTEKKLLFPDGVHPNAKGAKEIAKIAYKHLTGELENDIYRNEKSKLNASHYHVFRSGLKNSLIKFKRHEKSRIAFLGGSITYNNGWRDSIVQYLKDKFPKTKFEFIAAGVPSFGSTEDVFRLKKDVLANGPVDLLFVEAAVNDGGKGRSQKEITRSMEGIIQHTRNNDASTDIVFMYFVDPSKIKDYKQGRTPEVIQNHDNVATYYNISAINLAKEVTERIAAGEFTWEDDFKDIHPSPFGQGIYAHSIQTFLDTAWSDSIADDDTILNHPMPNKLDEFCYDKGKIIPAKEVKPTKGWTFIENWNPVTKAYTRANFIKVPMLVGTYPTKTLKFKFKGNAVGVAIAAGPDAGILEYKIDNGKWKQQDLFTKYSKSYHLPWYYTLADELKSGKHILYLRMSQDKNKNSVGNSCVIRYVYINEVE